jgi:hypothetical protein
MTKIRIIFDGSLVVGPTYPKQDHGPYERKGPLFAVLPHSPRKRSRRSKGYPPEYIPTHLPGIFTNMKTEGRDADLCYKGYSIWCPLRERMQFAINCKTEPGTLKYDHEPHYDCSCTGNLEEKVTDVAALSDMREIWRGRRRLRRGMLADGPRVSRRVAAQAFVPYGDVSAGSEYERRPATSAYNLCAEFWPPKNGTVKKRILPQVIVTVEARELELRMSSLDTGKQLDPVKFQLSNRTEDIWIVNGDVDNFRYVIDELTRPAGAPAQPSSPEPEIIPNAPIGTTPAVDFELIYTVLGGFDYGGLPIPYVFPLGQRPCYTSLVEAEPTGFTSFFSP